VSGSVTVTCSRGDIRSSFTSGLVGLGDGLFCRTGVEFRLDGDRL